MGMSATTTAMRPREDISSNADNWTRKQGCKQPLITSDLPEEVLGHWKCVLHSCATELLPSFRTAQQIQDLLSERQGAGDLPGSVLQPH